MTKVKYGSLSNKSMEEYQEKLINKIFKILGMKDDECDTLGVYVESLLFELVGMSDLICPLQESADYISLLSILENLTNEHEKAIVKQQVFKAIKLVKRIKFGEL